MITGAPAINCPDCGRSIPPAMPEGLCPACLAAAVVEVDSPPPDDNLNGIRYFGDYELLEEIGRGGMGVVYKARQLGVNRIVALKVLIGGSAAGRDFVHRFHTEAATAARLDHPHIVPIYEFGSHEGAHFLAMKFMEGGSLRDRRERIDPREAARLTILLAQAVQYAHQHGILHRDLKPANILLDAEGRPYVADFGLARTVDDETNLTASHDIIGTVAYIAPEVVKEGANQATTVSDVYGLGTILYELLAGQPAFWGASIPEVMRRVLEQEAAPPTQRSEAGEGTSRLGDSALRHSDLQAICLKCLEKAPANRYATAQDLADDLDRFLTGKPSVARSVTQTERIVRWARRNPVVAGLIATVVVVLLLGMGSTFWQLNRATENARESQRQVARLNVLNGVNLMQEGDLFRSLLWFTEALKFDSERNASSTVGQQRIASIIDQAPKLVNVIAHEGQPVGAAAFHPAQDQLATVGRDRRLRVWKIPSGEQVYATAPLEDQPSRVQFSPVGQMILITSFENNRARLFSAMDGKPLADPLPHFAGGANNKPLTPCFDGTGEHLLTQSAPNTLQVWSIENAWSGAPPAAPEIVLSVPVAWMAFSEDGESVIALTKDGKATAWDWKTGTRGADIPADALAGLKTSVPAPLIFSRRSGSNGVQAASSSVLGRESRLPLGATVSSPDGSRFATVSPDHRVRVWETETRRPLGPPIDHNQNTGPVAFSATGRYLFTIHPSYAVYVWELDQRPDPPVLLRPNAPPAWAETSQDGAVAVTRDPSRPIRVRSLSDASEVSLHPSSLNESPVQAWFDESGSYVVVEGEGQRAQIWNAATGVPVTPNFQSWRATNEADYLTIKLPVVHATSGESYKNAMNNSEWASIAELLSGSRLDGTGGWKPLELGEVIRRWSDLTRQGPQVEARKWERRR